MSCRDTKVYQRVKLVLQGKEKSRLEKLDSFLNFGVRFEGDGPDI